MSELNKLLPVSAGSSSARHLPVFRSFQIGDISIRLISERCDTVGENRVSYVDDIISSVAVDVRVRSNPSFDDILHVSMSSFEIAS